MCASQTHLLVRNDQKANVKYTHKLITLDQKSSAIYTRKSAGIRLILPELYEIIHRNLKNVKFLDTADGILLVQNCSLW